MKYKFQIIFIIKIYKNVSMNLSNSETYKLAGKLINKGYLIHCTLNEFKEFNPDSIVGGCRAKETLFINYSNNNNELINWTYNSC